MDILFIYPAQSVSERYGRCVGTARGNLPPLGLAGLAAFIRSKGFTCKIIDLAAENINQKKLIRVVNKVQPEVIGFSVLVAKAGRMIRVDEDPSPATVSRFSDRQTALPGVEICQCRRRDVAPLSCRGRSEANDILQVAVVEAGSRSR